MSTSAKPDQPDDARPDPEAGTGPVRRLRQVPIRMIIPNIITLLALCAGLTAIRMTIEGRYDLAVAFILGAAVLDGLDGRVARYLRSTSRFGAELDSLSDFVSFGAAPAILLFGWILDEVRSLGWLAAMLFAIAGALRLARFNVMLAEDKPAWQSNFFTGVPAPAGAILVMLPLFLDRSLIPFPQQAAVPVLLYTVLVAFLMVSRIPTFSGKKLGRVRRDLVLPLFVGLVLAVGLLLSYPFEMLSLVTFAYLLAIPFGWRTFNRLAKAHGAGEATVGFENATAEFPDDVEEGSTREG